MLATRDAQVLGIGYNAPMKAFKTIDNLPESEFEDRKSKFFGFLAHVETEQEAVEFRHSIMERIPDARHYVSAYVLHETGLEHYSDAKEPHGTAGLPVLNVLKGHELEDVVCIVARIFGGTLLGKGGLMRAYTKAAQLAVDDAHIVERTPCRDVIVSVPYPLYETLAARIAQEPAQTIDTAFADDVTLTLRTKSGDAEPLAQRIVDFSNGRAEYLIDDEEMHFLDIGQAPE